MKKVWEDIKAYILPAITLIQLGLTIYSAVASYIANSGISTLEWVLLFVSVVETSLILGWLLWRRDSFRAYYYPLSRITTDYIALSKTISYRVETSNNGNDELHYSREMEIKPQKANFDNFVDFYLWSGDFNNSPTLKPQGIQGIAEITDRKSIGIWTYFRVRLDQKITKSDTHKVKYEWPVINSPKTSKPFFSTTTEVPTKKLILKLDLGDEYKGQEVWLQVLRSNESLMQLEEVKKVKLSPHGEYSWDVEDVKRFRYYRIIWNWKKGAKPVDV